MPGYIFRIASLLLILLATSSVFADSFESLLLPGKVVSSHKKYEQTCSKCHDVKDKKKQNGLCRDCHKDIDKDLQKKSGFHGRSKAASRADCKTCHLEHQGRNADIINLDKHTFRHEFTDFKLVGAHKNVSCKQCHKPNKKYREASGQCVSCHKNDPHKGNLGKKCQQCHGQQLWSKLTFNHNKTDFKLTGAHKQTECKQCHINNKFSKTPKQCIACHGIDDVHNSKNGKKCDKCHSTRKWSVSKFNHDRETDFPLKGRHKNLSCSDCHAKNPYKNKIKNDCYSCHKKDDTHKEKYGHKCNQCHNTLKWSKVIFNHNRDTEYKLTGKHRKLKCSSCHRGNLATEKLKTSCNTCHELDDPHKDKSKLQCQDCHTTDGWKKIVKFDHDMSRFPLIGLHAITACDDCHKTRNYSKTPDECYHCHEKQDVHKLRFGKTCQICHNPNDWNLWRFDHNKDTRFELDGAHKKAHCNQCHRPDSDGIEKNQTCDFCHRQDDIHNGQFGRQCDRCHNSRTFTEIEMQ